MGNNICQPSPSEDFFAPPKETPKTLRPRVKTYDSGDANDFDKEVSKNQKILIRVKAESAEQYYWSLTL